MHESGKISGLFFRTRSYEKLLSGKITPGAGKVQAVAHTLEMGKYNEYSPMLDIVCAGKDVEGTYKVVKYLLEDFRNEEEFGYMAGYEPWEKLIFDR